MASSQWAMNRREVARCLPGFQVSPPSEEQPGKLAVGRCPDRRKLLGHQVDREQGEAQAVLVAVPVRTVGAAAAVALPLHDPRDVAEEGQPVRELVFV